MPTVYKSASILYQENTNLQMLTTTLLKLSNIAKYSNHHWPCMIS